MRATIKRLTVRPIDDIMSTAVKDSALMSEFALIAMIRGTRRAFARIVIVILLDVSPAQHAESDRTMRESYCSRVAKTEKDGSVLAPID
jgi:hypothetical protein